MPKIEKDDEKTFLLINNKIVTVFPEKSLLSSKLFLGHVECRFGNRARKFQSKLNFFLSRWWNDEKTKFSHQIHSIFPLDTSKAVLTTVAVFFCQTSKDFCWKSESDTKIGISANKTLFSSNFSFVHVDCRFGDRARKNQIKVLFSRPKVIKGWKILNFTEISLENFLWTHKKPCWKSCKVSFTKGAKEMRKLSQKKDFPSKYSSGLWDFTFHNSTYRKNIASRPNDFCCKSEENKLSFWKNFYISPKRSSGVVGWSFDNTARSVSLKVRISFAGISKPIKNCFYPNQFFCSKRSSGDVDFRVDNAADIFCQKIQNFSLLKLLKWWKYHSFFKQRSFPTKSFFGQAYCRFGNRSEKFQL